MQEGCRKQFTAKYKGEELKVRCKCHNGQCIIQGASSPTQWRNFRATCAATNVIMEPIESCLIIYCTRTSMKLTCCEHVASTYTLCVKVHCFVRALRKDIDVSSKSDEERF